MPNLPMTEKPRLPIARRRPLPVLLLDISYSMTRGAPRRIDVLWRAVQTLRTPNVPWKVAVFHDHCDWWSGEEPPTPDGETDLAGAFQMIGYVAVTQVTLVTDGEPNDMKAAHARGVALGCPISIVFVGDPDLAEAVAFCRRLCLVTGGTFATQAMTLTASRHLTAMLRDMLGTGAPPKSAIVLGETP